MRVRHPTNQMPIETFASERRAANLEEEVLSSSRQERLDYFLRFPSYPACAAPGVRCSSERRSASINEGTIPTNPSITRSRQPYARTSSKTQRNLPHPSGSAVIQKSDTVSEKFLCTIRPPVAQRLTTDSIPLRTRSSGVFLRPTAFSSRCYRMRYAMRAMNTTVAAINPATTAT